MKTRKSRWLEFIVLIAFYLIFCLHAEAQGNGSLAQAGIPGLPGHYQATFFYSEKKAWGTTTLTLLGPVVIWRSDFKEHYSDVDARNGGDWSAGKPSVTRTGKIEPDWIYYVEKGKAPYPLMKVPKNFTVKFTGSWSQIGASGIMTCRLLLDEDAPIHAELVKKLREAQGVK